MHLVQVGKGRNMSLAEVRKVAQGRIWSGEAALKHGLVDELGGLQTALRLAKEEAGLPLEVQNELQPCRPLCLCLMTKAGGWAATGCGGWHSQQGCLEEACACSSLVHALQEGWVAARHKLAGWTALLQVLVPACLGMLCVALLDSQGGL